MQPAAWPSAGLPILPSDAYVPLQLHRIMWLGLSHRVPQLQALMAGSAPPGKLDLVQASLGCIASLCTPDAVLGGTQLDLEKLEAGALPLLCGALCTVSSGLRSGSPVCCCCCCECAQLHTACAQPLCMAARMCSASCAWSQQHLTHLACL